MTVLPVIERELRAAARQPFTYYLRLLGVAALLLAGLLFGLDHGFGSNRGGALFSSLHTALFLAIWVLVPLLTADCLSRERREGTLGLLFLTPLRASGIVVAKGLAQGLRAATLWVAVLPVLTIPFLLGGVSWNQAVLSVLVNFSAICWALSAGLLASAWNRTWTRALLGAAVLAFLFVLALGASAGVFLFPTFTGKGLPRGYYPSPLFALLTGGGFVANWLGAWPAYLRVASSPQLLWAAGKIAAFALLVLATAILAAGAKTQRVWQEGPPSRRQLWLQATFCRPILWVSLLRRWMRWKLENNPVGWLGQRTWSGRLVTWGWFAVIIWGRLRGLWGQFLPAVAVLLGIWLYFSSIFEHRSDGEVILFHAATFLALPVIGLYFSLRCRGFMGAFLSTLAVGLLAPLALPIMLAFVWQAYVAANYSVASSGFLMQSYVLAASGQLVLAVIFSQRLHRRLRNRAFHLEDSRR